MSKLLTALIAAGFAFGLNAASAQDVKSDAAKKQGQEEMMKDKEQGNGQSAQGQRERPATRRRAQRRRAQARTTRPPRKIKMLRSRKTARRSPTRARPPSASRRKDSPPARAKA